MAQYIDKSALVVEIARQKVQWRICKSSEAKYRREMLDDISSFIDTLEVKEVQEEPVSEELEEAANAYIGYAPEVDESSSVYGKRQAFKAGAEWQKLKDMGITNNAKGVVTNILNSSDKPLDIYATEVAFIMLPANLTENYHMTNRDRISDAVRLGANWQKEYMEKEYSDLNKGLVSAKGVAVYMAYETGKKEVIGKVRSILNKVAYKNNGLDVNGDYCEQPYVELDNEFRKLLKED